jgi:tetratricopeptide (TPR) repeat protein
MKLRFLFFLTCLYLGQPLFAQSGNWKKNAKSADQLYANGNYEEAANYYLEAFKLKKENTEYLYKAANCYENLRFYKKAAPLYKELIDDKDFPVAALQYARSLKQSGEYEEAKNAFKNFLDNYKGTESVELTSMVKTEIEGCDFAMSPQSETSTLNIERLSENINTMANEVAPLPFNDEILYFSSTMEGFSKIFRSQYNEGKWGKAIIPDFPKFKDVHVCHGTFTPDNQRFYFTLCNNTEFDVADSKCDIYVTVRDNGDWNTPRKLRDYVKLEGTTATHPFVMYEEDMEILYFSSDRKGGKGGMDIWFMTRHVDSPEYDFTLPKNAGNNINTSSDEITPYYNSNDGILYFSSNGHLSIGGFDIFKSSGSMNKFSKAENVGAPINSSADDYYYIENKTENGSFVSSNRLYGSEKITTDNDDIFYFSVPEKYIYARGNIYDKSNNSIVKDAQVLLYEVKESGNRRLLQSILANNGTYQFSMIPERLFQIEVVKEGYENAEINFNTIAFDPDNEYGKPIYLEKEKMLSSTIEEPIFEESSSTASVGDNIVTSSPVEVNEPTEAVEPVEVNTTPIATTISTSQLNYVNSHYQGMEVTTTAPKLDGVYFKVQISTAGFFNETDPMFDTIRDLGNFQTEQIIDKGWTRILLAEYFSLSEARNIMDQARSKGYPEAFVVKYRNGKRLN